MSQISGLKDLTSDYVRSKEWYMSWQKSAFQASLAFLFQRAAVELGSGVAAAAGLPRKRIRKTHPSLSHPQDKMPKTMLSHNSRSPCKTSVLVGSRGRTAGQSLPVRRQHAPQRLFTGAAGDVESSDDTSNPCRQAPRAPTDIVLPTFCQALAPCCTRWCFVRELESLLKIENMDKS